MTQAKQRFVASWEEQGVTIRGERAQQTCCTEPESIHKAVMQLSDAIPKIVYLSNENPCLIQPACLFKETLISFSPASLAPVTE